MGFTSASWSADITTSAVKGGATSAGSNQAGSSEMCRPQIICDCVLAAGTKPMPSRTSKKAPTTTRPGPARAQSLRYLVSLARIAVFTTHCDFQPVRHPHLAVHRHRRGEMLLRLLALARLPEERAEAKVGVGSEGAQAELLGQRERRAIGLLGAGSVF